jgi:hypothetical protein
MNIRATTAAGAVMVGAAFAVLLGSAPAPAGGERAGGNEPECGLAEVQPEEPLAMNTVRVGNLVKTIATEKELFTCVDASGDVVQVHDLETFVEIVERRRGRGFATIGRRVDVAVCTKDLVGGTVSCGAKQMTLRPTQQPLRGCSAVSGTYPFEPIEQPRRPLEMNTVVVGDLVKTIKLDKEILQCGGLVGDVYLFTEIVQERVGGQAGPTFRPVSFTFDGVVCFKDPGDVRLVECRTFTPARRTPR